MGIEIVVSLPATKINNTDRGLRARVEITGYRGHVYVFLLNTRLSAHINDINLIVPMLEMMVADLCKKGRMSMGKDKLYYHPLHITLHQPDQPSQSWTVAGSARALANLLEDSRKGRLSPINGTLITHDRTKNYAYCGDFSILWDGGGLEWLASLYPKIEPKHLGMLTTIQISITPRARSILWAFSGLFRQGCLKSLKNVILQFAAASQPVLHHKGWICLGLSRDSDDRFGDNFMEFYYMIGIFGGLYKEEGEDNVPQLERFHVILWSERAKVALTVLSSQYQKLKALVVDDVMSTTKIESKHDYVSYSYNTTISYVGDYRVERTRTTEHDHDAHTLVPNDDPDLPTLDQLVEKYQADNQLEELQIYTWGIKGQAPQFDSVKLAKYIQNGWLPYLKHIVIRSHADYLNEDNKPINPITGLDTTDLLKAILDRKLVIEKLEFRMPEVKGYLPWIEAIKDGSFSHLTELYYLIPPPHENESAQDYEIRIRGTLVLLKKALVENCLPNIKQVVIHGRVPLHLEHLVQKIESFSFINTKQLSPQAEPSAAPSAPVLLEEDLADFEMV